MSDSESITREIPLTQGKVAIIDAADYADVSRFKWSANFNKRSGVWYAQAWTGGEVVSLHRHLMVPPKGMMVDHKDNDGLNCRRSNMRLATHTQNQHNCRKRKDNTSGFRGVSRSSRNRWMAVINVDGKQCYLGLFLTRELAAQAYDAKALEIRGEFARTNAKDRQDEKAPSL